MTFDAATMALLKTAVWETFYMVALSSFLAYVIGMPLGVILVVTDNDGIYPIPWLQKLLGLVINLLRSVPFLILLFIVLPLSKNVIGTRIGSPAIVIPITWNLLSGKWMPGWSRRPSPWGPRFGRSSGKCFCRNPGLPSFWGRLWQSLPY